MIDELDLVNMNGRVYDPTIGRFMSADPFIHDVTNSQDLNRYSYVHNNPLSFVDQNGYGFFSKIGKFFKKIWRALLAIVVAVTLQFELLPAILPETIFGSEFLAGAVTAGISGGVSNVVLTGKPKAFLSGFGQGFATFGVGHGIFAKVNTSFGSAGYFGKAVAHGVVGGAFAEIRGGSFRSGFLAAGFSAAAAPLAPSNIWAGAAFSAAVGGAGSILGGGKFADGAVTGAFTYLFNEIALRKNLADALGEQFGRKYSLGEAVKLGGIYRASYSSSSGGSRGGSGASFDEALFSAAGQLAGLTARTGNEWQTGIFHDSEGASGARYVYGAPVTSGSPDYVDASINIPYSDLTVSDLEAVIHSHTGAVNEGSVPGPFGDGTRAGRPWGEYVVGSNQQICGITYSGYSNCMGF